MFNNVLWVPTNLIGKISYFGTLKLRGLMFETYMDRKRLNCIGYKQQKINFSIWGFIGSFVVDALDQYEYWGVQSDYRWWYADCSPFVICSVSGQLIGTCHLSILDVSRQKDLLTISRPCSIERWDRHSNTSNWSQTARFKQIFDWNRFSQN